MIRTHQMPTGELGTWLALIIGVGGAIGVFGSGVIADKLGKLTSAGTCGWRYAPASYHTASNQHVLG